ncbi:MAG: response regulator [Desulfobacteraceae bacterium]|nr:response regulator [Desulfobacteraceae bacterium]
MKGVKILIVEDEALIGEGLKEDIVDLGFSLPKVVNSGEKALSSIKADKPDLVLMDIKIKGDMDGIEVAEIIKKDNGPPVVFLTAYGNKEFISRAKITEPFGYLIKPVDYHELNSTITITLYRAKIERERNELLEKLKATQKELEKARNCIPICAKCKKIRDDKGYWDEVESYVEENFSATFSHSICPKCSQELYPDLFEE